MVGKSAHEREAVEIRHHEVEHDDVILAEAQLQNGFDAVGRLLHAIALALENHLEQASDSPVVFNDEDLARLVHSAS